MRRALTDEALLSAAFSAESVLIEVIFIVGPLVVAAFAATAAPALAVWFSAGCALVGTLVFLRSPALQGWRIERRSATGLFGPLARRDFAHLVESCSASPQPSASSKSASRRTPSRQATPRLLACCSA